MPWLVSYEYVAVYKRADGAFRRNQPTMAFEVTQVHPAQFVAESRLKLSALHYLPFDPSQGPQRADEITRMFSAIEVPDGTLTPAMLEAFE